MRPPHGHVERRAGEAFVVWDHETLVVGLESSRADPTAPLNPCATSTGRAYHACSYSGGIPHCALEGTWPRHRDQAAAGSPRSGQRSSRTARATARRLRLLWRGLFAQLDVVIPPGDPADETAEPAVGCSSPVNNAPPVAVLACASLLAQVAVDHLTGGGSYPDDVVDVLGVLPGEPPFDVLGRVQLAA